MKRQNVRTCSALFAWRACLGQFAELELPVSMVGLHRALTNAKRDSICGIFVLIDLQRYAAIIMKISRSLLLYQPPQPTHLAHTTASPRHITINLPAPGQPTLVFRFDAEATWSFIEGGEAAALLVGMVAPCAVVARPDHLSTRSAPPSTTSLFPKTVITYFHLLPAAHGPAAGEGQQKYRYLAPKQFQLCTNLPSSTHSTSQSRLVVTTSVTYRPLTQQPPRTVILSLRSIVSSPQIWPPSVEDPCCTSP